MTINPLQSAISRVPPETWVKIAKDLDVETVLRLSRVNRFFRIQFSGRIECFWSSIFTRNYCLAPTFTFFNSKRAVLHHYWWNQKVKLVLEFGHKGEKRAEFCGWLKFQTALIRLDDSLYFIRLVDERPSLCPIFDRPVRSFTNEADFIVAYFDDQSQGRWKKMTDQIEYIPFQPPPLPKSSVDNLQELFDKVTIDSQSPVGVAVDNMPEPQSPDKNVKDFTDPITGDEFQILSSCSGFDDYLFEYTVYNGSGYTLGNFEACVDQWLVINSSFCLFTTNYSLYPPCVSIQAYDFSSKQTKEVRRVLGDVSIERMSGMTFLFAYAQATSDEEGYVPAHGEGFILNHSTISLISPRVGFYKNEKYIALIKPAGEFFLFDIEENVLKFGPSDVRNHHFRYDRTQKIVVLGENYITEVFEPDETPDDLCSLHIEDLKNGTTMTLFKDLPGAINTVHSHGSKIFILTTVEKQEKQVLLNVYENGTLTNQVDYTDILSAPIMDAVFIENKAFIRCDAPSAASTPKLYFIDLNASEFEIVDENCSGFHVANKYLIVESGNQIDFYTFTYHRVLPGITISSSSGSS